MQLIKTCLKNNSQKANTCYFNLETLYGFNNNNCKVQVHYNIYTYVIVGIIKKIL